MFSAAPRADASSAPLRPATVVLFWLPLAATWLMMGLEGPYVAAIVARMPDAAYGLAAFGVATSLAWLIESPVMMLLTASTALVRDRASYLALRRFAWMLNGLVTVGMMVLAIPPVFRFVGQGMIGLPPEISRLAHAATVIMIFWPAAIGYRRFYQRILVRYGQTRRVAYGTVVRLLSMSVTAAVLALATSMSGALLGAAALLMGVLAEAVVSRWMAREIVRTLKAGREVAAGTLLSLRAITGFYFPLALTSVLSMALLPLVTFGLGRGRLPIESLAVWPVVGALVFLFRSGGIAYQEVGIALGGADESNLPVVRQTARRLGGFASLALAVVAFTPLQVIWFETVSGLPPALAAIAVWPLRILLLMPALDYLLSMQRLPWILAHRTGIITTATAIEAAGLALALFVAVGAFGLVGAVAGAIAMVVGRLAANLFLGLRQRPSATVAGTAAESRFETLSP